MANATSDALFEDLAAVGFEAYAQMLKNLGYELHAPKRGRVITSRHWNLADMLEDEMGERAFAEFDDAHDDDEVWDRLKVVTVVEVQD